MADSTVVAIILSLVIMLLVATGMSVLTKRVRMPLSIALVLVGLVLGELIRLYPELGLMTRMQLSEEMLLYVFLPTLVFNASFAVDARLLLKNIEPVLVLAIPAVIISFAGVGYGLHWTLGMPLGAALLFGALITATDSSAVLSIFKEIGAPKRLNVLVQGENLLNDAVSVVIFLLAAGAVGVGSASLPEGANVFVYGVVEFLVAFVGGLGTGVAMGWIFGTLIGAVENDDLIEILLTTVVAFLAFLVAELAVGASGITAVVGAGLTLGGWGRTKYSPGTLDYLTRFWAYLAFIVNSLVFLLTGLAIEWRPAFLSIGLVAIVVAFLVSTVARAISIYGLFPLVNVLPGVERTSVPYQSAIAWGGIRGGVALALALTLPIDYAEREMLVGLTVGVVVFSLFIQGLTLEPVIRWLGLHKVTPQEAYGRDEAVLRVKRAGRGRIPELRSGGVISESVAGRVEEKYLEAEQEVLKKVEDMRHQELVGAAEETKLLSRQMLLAEKRSYLELFQMGVLSEKVFKDLQHVIDGRLDRIRQGEDLPPRRPEITSRWGIEKLLFRVLDTVAPTGRVAQRFRLNRIAERYEAHWARVISASRVTTRLDWIKDGGAFQTRVVESLIQEYQEWRDEAQEQLDSIGDQFPEYAAKVQELVALRLCLRGEERAIEELAELDALSDRDVHALEEQLYEELHDLRQKPIAELRTTPQELLAKVPFFEGLPEREFERIVTLLRQRTLLPDEAVVKQGEAGDAMYLIGRGVVRVTVKVGDDEAKPIATLLAGDFFGEMAILSDSPRTATCTTATDAVLYELRREDLETALDACPTMRGVLEEASRKRAEELRESGVQVR